MLAIPPLIRRFGPGSVPLVVGALKPPPPRISTPHERVETFAYHNSTLVCLIKPGYPDFSKPYPSEAAQESAACIKPTRARVWTGVMLRVSTQVGSASPGWG
eukprot:1195678-Prorocentrum_minimum.AAC.6